MSHSSYSYLTMNNRFTTEYRGQIEMKVGYHSYHLLRYSLESFQGKGTNSTYWLIGKSRKPSLNNVINKSPSQLTCPFSGKFSDDHKPTNELV